MVFMPFDPLQIRKQFPIFRHHPELIYADNAASTQKPNGVLHATARFEEFENATVHRGLYPLSSSATRRFEAVRTAVAGFIGASDASTIAFTHGTTESINIVAESVRHMIRKGDKILLSSLEHHANLLPWQRVARETGAVLRFIPLKPDGTLDITAIDKLLDEHTRVVALTHFSNVTGAQVEVEQIIAFAKKHHAITLIDAAQSAGHHPINVQALDVDFLAFSAHKMFGPFGTGVLYAHPRLHFHMQPLILGGGHVTTVSRETASFQNYPHGVEAGTPNVSGVIGLDAALSFINSIGLPAAVIHTRHLATLFREALNKMNFINPVGAPVRHNGIVSFNIEGVHPHDVASFLGARNIAVRAGLHCAEPLHQAMNIPASVRASFSVYNTTEEVYTIVDALKDCKTFWS